MNIYLQDIAVATSLSSIDDAAKKNIQDLCENYPDILRLLSIFFQVKVLVQPGIYFLKPHQRDTERMEIDGAFQFLQAKLEHC